VVGQSVITQAETVKAESHFFGFDAQEGFNNVSDTVFLDIPTVERTIFWSSSCCSDPATFKVETDAETVHRFALYTFRSGQA
jgi:hypothetical protein